MEPLSSLAGHFTYTRRGRVTILLLGTVLLAGSLRADLIYVTDHYDGTILKYTPDGQSSVFATGLNPYGIAVDAGGNVYVGNGDQNRTIRKFTTNGVGSVFATLGVDVGSPSGLAFDSSGNLYAANPNNTIWKFTPAGVGTLFASGLGFPYSLACDGADNLFAPDIYGIDKFTPSGVRSAFAPLPSLYTAIGLAFDPAGNLYTDNIYPGLGYNIMRFTPNGTGSVFASSGLSEPWGLAFDGAGNLFVVNNGSGAILKIAPNGTGSVFANVGAGKPLSIAIWVAPTPPAILQSPASQTAESGTSVKLLASASGTKPLWYQWYLGETNLVGSSPNNILQLTNVQTAQSGLYTVLVTNPVGMATSAPAALSVIAPVDRRSVPGLNLTGQLGSVLDVHCADSLSPVPGWATLASVSLSSTSQFYFDLTLPLPSQRFYRTQQSQGAPPALDVHLVPALTLTGALGSSVRVDAINRLGPIDAWLTLGTATLTNTPQFFFDVLAIGQPERLYRLVPLP